jgi:hypothetical protein
MEEEPGCIIEKKISFKRSEDCVEEDPDNPVTRGFFFDSKCIVLYSFDYYCTFLNGFFGFNSFRRPFKVH